METRNNSGRIYSQIERLLPEWLFHPENEELKRVALIAYPTVLIAVVILIIISSVRLRQHYTALGIIELSFAMVLAGILIYYSKTKAYDNHFFATLGVAAYGIFSIYLFFFNQHFSHHFIWSYTFPLMVFPILGSLRGMLAVVLFLIPIFLFLLVDSTLSFITSYPRSFILPYIVSISTISGLSYLYEWNREKSQQQLKLANIALQRTNEGIEEQVRLRTEELSSSEQNYRFLTERMSDIVWTTDMDLTVTYVSPSVERILGFNPEEYGRLPFYARVTPESFGKSMAIFAYELEQSKLPVPDYERDLKIELEFCRKDGSTVWMESIINAILNDEGNLVGVHGLSRDVTDRKQAEALLRESEEKYRLLVEKAYEAIYVAQDGMLKFINRAGFEIAGYSEQELISRPFIEFIHPDDRAMAGERYQRRLKGEEFESRHTFRFITKNGDIKWLESGAALIDFEGRPATLNFVTDITDRQRTQEALRESETRYRLLAENAMDVIWTVDIEDMRLTYASPSVTRLLGFTVEEAMARTMQQAYVPEAFEKAMQMLAEEMTIESAGHGDPTRSRMLELDLVRKDGNTVPVEGNFCFLRDPAGKAIGILSIIRDITERKLAEEALRESWMRFQMIADNTRDVIWMLDMNHQFIFMSSAIEQMLGYTSEEYLAKPHSDILVPASLDLLYKVFAEELVALESDPKRALHGSRIVETEQIHKNGSRLWVELKMNFMHDADGNAVGILGFSRDITERKLAEVQLHASLREKEILLSEIHHRVKNNMQVITSLLDLQARSTGNPELTEKLNESKSRIRSMAMIHEKLYDSKDFTRIDLFDYVRALSQELFQLYKINPGKIDLVIQSDGVIYMDINKTIPCSLILNELISNALKHAFPGDRQGKLQILITETEKKEIEIVICDNGLGLPDDVDIHEPQTTGLYLVNGLVKNQLDGQIEVRRDNGTEFRIKFPLWLEEKSL